MLATQRKLDLALESGAIGSYSANFGIGEVVVDERYLAQLGYRPGGVEVNVAWWLENAHPDDLAAFAEQSERVMHGGLDEWTLPPRSPILDAFQPGT